MNLRPQICVAQRPALEPVVFPVAAESEEDQVESFTQPVPGKTVFPVVNAEEDSLSQPRPATYTHPATFIKEYHREEHFPCLATDRLRVTGVIESPEITTLKKQLGEIVAVLHTSIPTGSEAGNVELSDLRERMRRVEAGLLKVQGFLTRAFGNR